MFIPQGIFLQLATMAGKDFKTSGKSDCSNFAV